MGCCANRKYDTTPGRVNVHTCMQGQAHRLGGFLPLPPLAKRVLGLQRALSVMDSEASPFHLGFVLQTAVESKEQKNPGWDDAASRPVFNNNCRRCLSSFRVN